MLFDPVGTGRLSLCLLCTDFYAHPPATALHIRKETGEGFRSEDHQGAGLLRLGQNCVPTVGGWVEGGERLADLPSSSRPWTQPNLPYFSVIQNPRAGFLEDTFPTAPFSPHNCPELETI